tara:strand:- start:48 stop:251 length:204 start_codon:yes stop_codon:yes gene_type:complete
MLATPVGPHQKNQNNSNHTIYGVPANYTTKLELSIETAKKMLKRQPFLLFSEPFRCVIPIILFPLST